MLTDTQIRFGTEEMIKAIPVPGVPFKAIQQRIALRRPADSKPVARRRLAAAAAIMAVVLPTVAFAVANYEAHSRAALRAQGGWAPPAPPADFLGKLRPKTVSRSQAQAAVDFSLTEPSGLPAGASLRRIDMVPVGLYDSAAHRWRVGPSELVFRYRLGDGEPFMVNVRRFDPSNLPGRYVFEDRGPDGKGNPQLVKHQNFAWRTGDQMTVVSTGDGIDEGGIVTMARSMNGALVTLPWPSSHSQGTLRVIAP